MFVFQCLNENVLNLCENIRPLHHLPKFFSDHFAIHNILTSFGVCFMPLQFCCTIFAAQILQKKIGRV